MDFEKNIKKIEEIIGYEFTDKSLLRQAFTRASFCNENRGSVKYQSNEVLEFFGDSVLSTAIITLLMHDKSKRYEFGISTDLDEGDFSNIRSKLSDKTNLSHATEVLGLEKYLIMGEGDRKLGIEREPSVKEDLFESIIGAIYIDCRHDMKTVIASVGKMLDTGEYLKSGKVIQSYKNALQEYCADKKRRLPPPVYKTVSEFGPEHKKTYKRACYIGDKLYGEGEGKNFKIADAIAAENALNKLTAAAEKKSDTPPTLSDAIRKLKEIAEKEKKTAPEFRDLGETLRSTPIMREYEIECRFMGAVAHGTGADKRSAKEMSAERLLRMITKERDEGVRKAIKSAERRVKHKDKAPISKNKKEKAEISEINSIDESKKVTRPTPKRKNVDKERARHQNTGLKQHRAAKTKRS